ncbi:MAG: CopD family protein [Acetobacteraceae bacterium]|nr:CopD family protein [Acetobacteraceae bacterium]
MTADTAIALARGAHLACVLSALGAAAVRAAIAPPALRGLDGPSRRRVERPVAVVLLASIAAALALALVWIVAEAGSMGSASGPLEALADVPAVLTDTVFGQAIVVRIACLLLAAATFRLRWAACACAFLAAALEARMGHAAGVADWGLPLSIVLHMTASGLWLGALLPLLLLVGRLPAGRAAVAAARFSPLGLACVVVLAGTAFFQGRVLIGSVAGLVGTEYGHLAAIKLGLFAVLVGLAALNRLSLTPLLRRGSGAGSRALRRSIAVEAVLGGIVVLVAAQLAGLYPGAHEEADWPFPWRVEMANAFDPDLRREILPALAALAVAALGGGVSLCWRRLRIPGALAALLIAVLALPHLSPLLVPAYPTSYYVSLTDFAAGSIVRGAALFARNCVACHGPEGRGDGPAGKGLHIPPADLTAPHIWMHPDGELFWWIGHGIEDPEGGLAMPGFGNLSDTDRWALIDYLRAHAAGAQIGAQIGADHRWPYPVQAPALVALCDRGRVLSNDDLRGRVWRIVFGTTAPPADMPTILLAPQRVPGACVADDEASRRALLIVCGLSPEDADGTQVLVDAENWLRATVPPGQTLDAAIAATPLPAPAGGHHH